MNEEFIKIVKLLLNNVKKIIFSSLLITSLSLFYLLFVFEKDYSSTAKIYQSTNSSSSLTGGLSQLGIKIPFANSGGASQNLSFVSEIFSSSSFIEELIFKEITIDSNQSTIQLHKFFNDENTDHQSFDLKYKEDTILKIKESIKTSEIYESSVIKIVVTTKNAIASQSLNQLLISESNKYLTNQKNASAEYSVNFIDSRINEVQNELTSAENLLKDFKYKNKKIISSPDLEMQYENLVRNVLFKQEIMLTLLSEREVARIKSFDKNRELIILENPTLPYYSSSTRRLYQLIAFFIFSIIFPVTIILLKEFLKNLKNIFKKSF